MMCGLTTVQLFVIDQFTGKMVRLISSVSTSKMHISMVDSTMLASGYLSTKGLSSLHTFQVRAFQPLVGTSLRPLR